MRLKQLRAVHLGKLAGRRRKTPQILPPKYPLILAAMRARSPSWMQPFHLSHSDIQALLSFIKRECPNPCLNLISQAHLPHKLYVYYIPGRICYARVYIFPLCLFDVWSLPRITQTLPFIGPNNRSWNYRAYGLCPGPKESPEDREIIKPLTSTLTSKGNSPRK